MIYWKDGFIKLLILKAKELKFDIYKAEKKLKNLIRNFGNGSN